MIIRDTNKKESEERRSDCNKETKTKTKTQKRKRKRKEKEKVQRKIK